MPVDIYITPGSPPCGAVLLAAKIIGVDINLKSLNLATEEHQTPEFKKLNPQATVPTIVDNGFALYESRAILIYFAEKFAKDKTLYPEDLAQRATVNQRLFYDLGTLYNTFGEYYYPTLFAGETPDAAKLEKFQNALGILEVFLQDQKYVAGSNLTIADLSMVPTIALTERLGIIDLKSKYPNIQKWLNNIKNLAVGYDIIEKGVADFMEFIQNLNK